jgi:3-oxoacyl-[acyl-carrier-protein] synthase II
MSNRVVITGIAPVSSTGTGQDTFFRNICEQKTCIETIPEVFEKNYAFRSRHYVPLPEISLLDYAISQQFKSIMQDEQKMAVVGAKLALEDAGIAITRKGNVFDSGEYQNSSVVLGIGVGGMESAFHSYLAHAGKEAEISELLGKNIRYNRMVIPTTMPNSAAAWISIFFGLKGSCHTVNASCASGTVAIGNSFLRIRDGYDKLVITGGVECLKERTGVIMRGFDILNVLTKSPDGLPVPFSKNRSGFLFSEGGCCILVLEQREHAIKRGATIYAEIIDYHSNSDAFNIVQIDKSASQIIDLLKRLKGERTIDYLNTHGTGTRENDETEAMAIRTVFGSADNQPLIGSTKGLTGHNLGASGALEAAVTAMSLNRSVLHGTTVPEPIDDLNLISQTIEKPIEHAVSVSYGFGGHNAGLLFKRP